MFFSDILYDTTGQGVAGVQVVIYQPNGTSEIARVTTGSGVGEPFPGMPRGYWEFKMPGDPYGGLVWQAEVNGVVRRGSSFPTGQSRFAQIGQYHNVMRMMGKGVVYGLTPSALGGTRQVRLQPGLAIGAGIVFDVPEGVVADSPSGPVPPSSGVRTDVLVARITPADAASGIPGQAVLQWVTGTTIPNDTSSAVYVPIAQATLGAGSSTYTSVQPYGATAFPQRAPVISRGIFRDWGASAVNLGTSPSNLLSSGVGEPILQSGVKYHAIVRSNVILYTSNGNIRVEQTPFLTYNGVTYESPAGYQGHAAPAQWVNVHGHLKIELVGNGTAAAFGARGRRTAAGNGNYLARTADVTFEAIPER